MNIEKEYEAYEEKYVEAIKHELEKKQAKELRYPAEKILQNSSISDEVRLEGWNSFDFDKLHKTYLNNQNIDDFELPVDLFVANTIPIKDILIKEDHQQYRVVVTENCAEQINALKNHPKKPLIIGAVEYETGDDIVKWKAKFALVILYGVNKVLLQRVWENIFIPYDNIDVYYGPCRIWYLIQLSLLHPYVRNVYKNPAKIIKFTVKDTKSNKNNKKRKIIYKKYHVVSLDDLITFSNDDKKINRKCLCWYVIGHWREYKDHKTFIQGYWKGILRDVKKNLDEGRERVVIE